MSDQIKLLKSLEFLERHALKEHRVIYKTAQPGHGDPGGWTYVDEHCAALVFDTSYGGTIKFTDDSKCDCGAASHNLGVKNMVAEIRIEL